MKTYLNDLKAFSIQSSLASLISLGQTTCGVCEKPNVNIVRSKVNLI